MRLLHLWLPRIWLRRGPVAWLLRPLSWLYGALLALRLLAYRQGWLQREHPGIPVIVVGNVVVGGAGKTPTTIALVQHLLACGIAVGVVSRGHGRQGLGICAVQANSSPAEVGDEPLLIWQRTGVPVWVGRSRAQAAMALRHAHPEVRVLVCDDGLQHWALQRDLEICVMDERGPGNGWLLPAGPLREPWPRAVDLLLYTDGVPRPHAFAAQRLLASEALNGLGQHLPLSAWQDTPVDAVAGLARPEAFFAMLRQAGLHLADTWPLPDHDDFAHWRPTASGRPLLCTQKDAAKLWPHQPQAWAVPLQLHPEAGFWQALDHWLRQRRLMP